MSASSGGKQSGFGEKSQLPKIMKKPPQPHQSTTESIGKFRFSCRINLKSLKSTIFLAKSTEADKSTRNLFDKMRPGVQKGHKSSSETGGSKPAKGQPVKKHHFATTVKNADSDQLKAARKLEKKRQKLQLKLEEKQQKKLKPTTKPVFYFGVIL